MTQITNIALLAYEYVSAVVNYTKISIYTYMFGTFA